MRIMAFDTDRRRAILGALVAGPSGARIGGAAGAALVALLDPEA
jgi:hypothetical protein